MIVFNSSLPRYYADLFLKRPIRSKTDALKFLFNAIEFVNIGDKLSIGVEDHRLLVLFENRMHRLFFSSPKKIYSINFPFKIEEDDNGDIYVSSLYGRINEKMVSLFKRLLSIEGLTEENSFYSLVDNYEEALKDFDLLGDDSSIWPLFISLLKMEDGYFRYDYDDHEERLKQGHVHPLNHIDVFYTRGNQIKIGLTKTVTYSDVISIIDQQSDCYYIKRHDE